MEASLLTERTTGGYREAFRRGEERRLKKRSVDVGFILGSKSIFRSQTGGSRSSAYPGRYHSFGAQDPEMWSYAEGRKNGVGLIAAAGSPPPCRVSWPPIPSCLYSAFPCTPAVSEGWTPCWP